MDKLAAKINCIVIEGVLCNGRVPVKPKPFIWYSRRPDACSSSGLQIYSTHRATLRLCITIAGISGYRHCIKTITAYQPVPVFIYDCSTPFVGRPFPASVILKSSVNIVRHLHINCYMVELGKRKIHNMFPCPSHVIGYGQTAIITIHHMLWVLRINPPCMAIGVNVPAYGIWEAKTTVLTHANIGMDGIQPVLILWIDMNFGIVEWPAADTLFTALLPPESAVG